MVSAVAQAMRTADLIEMNMKNSGETDFSMAKAYTWIHGDTKLSIRYMFGSVMPFEESYRKQGYTGHIFIQLARPFSRGT